MNVTRSASNRWRLERVELSSHLLRNPDRGAFGGDRIPTTGRSIHRTLRLLIVLTLTLAGWYCTAATAAAELVDNSRQRLDFSVPSQLCDIPVQFSISTNTHVLAVRRGNDGRTYTTINIHDVLNWTNPSTGRH